MSPLVSKARKGEAAIVVMADHGMEAKSRGLDLGRVLREAGIQAEAVPIVKDRCHDLPQAISLLATVPGVEKC
jgi:hypothetical protein